VASKKIKIKKFPAMKAIDMRKDKPITVGSKDLTNKGDRTPFSRLVKKDGGAAKFPDLNKDGKVTKADILKGRGVPGFGQGGTMCSPRKEMAGAMQMPTRITGKK